MERLQGRLELITLLENPRIESEFDRIITTIQISDKKIRHYALIDTGAYHSIIYYNFFKRLFNCNEDFLFANYKIVRMFGTTSQLGDNYRNVDDVPFSNTETVLSAAFRIKIKNIWIGNVGFVDQAFLIPIFIHLDHNNKRYSIECRRQGLITSGGVLIGTNILRKIDYGVFSDDNNKAFFYYSSLKRNDRQTNDIIFNFSDWKPCPFNANEKLYSREANSKNNKQLSHVTIKAKNNIIEFPKR